jgi:tetratricopeptide (TPR) repeat protein
MPEKTRIFISHTHTDELLARALHELVRTVFGGAIGVVYSTSKELEGGPSPGRDWFRWITTQVRESRIAIVLLTPSSVQKPWVLWEAGAVFGAALGSREDAGNVLPVTFQLKTSEIPSPIEKQKIQAVKGDDSEEVRRLMEGFIGKEFEDVLSKAEVVNAMTRLQEGLAEYRKRVRTAMLQVPVMPTEASIQEWLVRIQDLKDENRLSEVDQLRQWLEIAFGRDPDDQAPLPLDLRIHRSLGEVYRGARENRKAIEQFELARRLAPRDLFILRMLGLALLATKDYERSLEVMKQMEELDDRAFVRNAECAAMRGRWLREKGRDLEARDVYEAALDENPSSYYLADLLGQTKLALGDREGAQAAYATVQRILEEVDARNVWTLATSATAKLVQENEPGALEDLRAIRQERPTPATLESVERGLSGLRRSLGKDEATFERWREALRS